ncbi:MAG TPA: oligosaccharide flippase family protein [Steroidobacteraceae bacterium]|nr:oligosaccharide flippase family protein [Steroidobacteraceae bacterium]
MTLYSPQRARRSLLQTIGFRAVSQLATVLSYIVLVRAMREEPFGIYNLFYSFIPVISTLASFGLEQTLRRFQPEYLRSERPSLGAWLVRFVATARFAVSIVMLGIILLAWNLIAPHFSLQAYRADFALFAILVVLYLQSIILQLSLAAHMLHIYSVGSLAALAVVKLVVYSFLSSRGELTLRAAILADIAAYSVTYLFLVVVHRRIRAQETPGAAGRLTSSERKRLTRYAVYNHLNDAGSLLVYAQTDNFFVGAMLSPVAVATYAFYARLVEMITNIIPIKLFENVVQPLFFAVPGKEADSRLPRYFTLLVDINLVVQLPAIAFALAYHRELVEVFFGGKYLQDSALLPLVIAMSTVPNVLAVPVTLVAQYFERPGLILVSELFGVYQVVAMLVLVPMFGLYGAAVSTGSFHLLRNLFVWWNLREHVSWRNAAAVLVMGTLVWSAVVLACSLLRTVLPLSALGNLAVGVVLCGLGVLVYLRSPAISQSDRQILANVLHGREARMLRWLGLTPRTA